LPQTHRAIYCLTPVVLLLLLLLLLLLPPQAPLLVEQGLLRAMEAALWRDTSFLASLGVMDYSLLVGECALLHCGIATYSPAPTLPLPCTALPTV
jgi:hypothetical protein